MSSAMDIQATTVAWASFIVTTIGLGGLITQASAIGDQLDPFYSTRSAKYLGVWFQRQRKFPWYRITKPAPKGPLIVADAISGFCGRATIYLMRIPPATPGSAGWATLLAMFHCERPLGPVPPVIGKGAGGDFEALGNSMVMTLDGTSIAADGWPFLEQRELVRHKMDACVTISRTTLITMLVMTNGRPVYEYKSATGYRAGFASYAGQWYITWPIGEEAVVKFARHDSLRATEVLPRFFPQRVDRCGQMICGIVSSSPSSSGKSSLKVAFCGRKFPGVYKLELGKNGFQGAHGSRHLYNMMGGNAYEFDYLFARKLRSEQSPMATITLTLPAREEKGSEGKNREGEVHLIVPPAEDLVIRHALDCLSWTSLSWSMHRGLRDIVLAYTKPTMDSHRLQLGQLVLQAVQDNEQALQAMGWEASFVKNNMGHMAATAILAGAGNSGDSVRVVTDIVSLMVGEPDLERLDEVVFWRREPEERPRSGAKLDNDAIVALTKVFVVEWSQEFDYQAYHHLPIQLLLG